ncbi:MAG TPA: hypothetical protein VGH50_18580 [Candidatus Binatia bacterium]|jgi:hypothetical protein
MPNTAYAIIIALMLVVTTGRMSLSQNKPAAGDKPASNLEIVHDKLKADKKLIVAKYMELTESEAAKFWPVYEEYQSDLQKSNERLRALLQSYAADYNNKSLSDEKAKKLMDDWIALERDEGNRRSAFAPKVLKAVPVKKAARYLQIENEYRTMLRYEMAGYVPLAQ